MTAATVATIPPQVDRRDPAFYSPAAVACPSCRGVVFCDLPAGHAGGHFSAVGEVHVRWAA